MRDELLRILNVKLDDIKNDIGSLNELNAKIADSEDLLDYTIRTLEGFKENESYNILKFVCLSKNDFEKVLSIVSNNAEKIFNSPSCNYDGLVYLITGINNGVSLSLTEEQKSGIEYLIRGLNEKQKEFKAHIEELHAAKSRFRISEVEELEDEKALYEEIARELESERYVTDVDKVYEAITFASVGNDHVIDLLKYLLEYNASVHQKGVKYADYKETPKVEYERYEEEHHEYDTHDDIKISSENHFSDINVFSNPFETKEEKHEEIHHDEEKHEEETQEDVHNEVHEEHHDEENEEEHENESYEEKEEPSHDEPEEDSFAKVTVPFGNDNEESNSFFGDDGDVSINVTGIMPSISSALKQDENEESDNESHEESHEGETHEEESHNEEPSEETKEENNEEVHQEEESHDDETKEETSVETQEDKNDLVPDEETHEEDTVSKNEENQEENKEETEEPTQIVVAPSEYDEIVPSTENNQEEVNEESEEATGIEIPAPIVVPEIPEDAHEELPQQDVETESPVEAPIEGNPEDVQNLFNEYGITLSVEGLSADNIDNYRKVIATLKENNLLDKFLQNEALFMDVLKGSGKEEIENIIRIVRDDLSVDNEDYEMTMDIVINTIPSIFIYDGGSYQNFVKNCQKFSNYGINLIKLFDFSKEIFLVDTETIEKNHEVVQKYHAKLDYNNAKYLLVLPNIGERMDYFVETEYSDKTKNNEMFDGIGYINDYTVKLSTVKPETIKRLRYASENNRKVFGSKPNSLAGEITNLKVTAMDIPEDYMKSFFDNNFDGLTSDEVREYAKLVNNSSNVGNYADELAKLETYRIDDMKYRIEGVIVSSNKVARNYDVLRSYGIDAKKALHFAICNNLVITKEEYLKIKSTIEEIGGNA